jgi:hypothetical protein
VEGSSAAICTAFIVGSSSEILPILSGCGGVALPELDELDPDVHILESSDSSSLLLLSLLRVNEFAKGCFFSEER